MSGQRTKLSPVMQGALAQWERSKSLSGVRKSTVNALVRRGLIPADGGTIQEVIGVEHNHNYLTWEDRTRQRFIPTMDARIGDYAWWDQLRRGRIEGMEIAAAFCKPIESKVSAWTLGGTPKFASANADAASAVGSWWGVQRKRIVTAMRESIALGEAYLVFNGDGSLTVVEPHVVKPLVDAGDWSRVVGYRITQSYGHPDRLIGVMTIEEDYTAKERVRRTYMGAGLVKSERFRNPLGLIPVVKVRNNASPSELNGRPEAEALVKILEWYNEIFVASMQGNIRQGRPTPVMDALPMETLEYIMENMTEVRQYRDTDGETRSQKVVQFDADSLSMFPMHYAQPGSFANDTQTLLGLLFYLVLQHTEIPEFIWGNAIASSNASADAQMPSFVAYIEGKWVDTEDWRLELLALAVRWLSLFDPAVSEADVVTMQQAVLTTQDGQLTLAAIRTGLEFNLLSRAEALRQMPLDIDDPEAVLAAADAEVQAERDALVADRQRQVEADTGFDVAAAA